jgi:hypothetical protein
MVRAIMDGRKTQTRRIVKLGHGGTFRRSETNGYDWTFRGSRRGGTRYHSSCWQDLRHEQLMDLCPYGHPGDRLWVRETWAPVWTFDPSPETGALYRADPMYDGTEQFDWPWKPSIHMPRWASRITLEITGVRVERLREISDFDAIAEGVSGWVSDPRCETPRDGFRVLWESINGEGSWAANPWVWVVEFERHA